MTQPFNPQRSVEGMTPDKIQSTMVEAVQAKIDEYRDANIDGEIAKAEGYRDDIVDLVAALVHLIGSTEHAPDDFEFDPGEVQDASEIVQKMWLQVASNNSTYSEQIQEGLQQIEQTNQQLTRDVEDLKREIREGYAGDSEFLREEIDKIRDDVKDSVLATIVDGAPEHMDTFAEAYAKFGTIKEQNELLTKALDEKLNKSEVGTATTQGMVVQRTTGGQIFVPPNPSAHSHAAPKSYVDSEIQKVVDAMPSGGNFVNALSPNVGLWIGTAEQYQALSSTQKNDPNVIRVVRE